MHQGYRVWALLISMGITRVFAADVLTLFHEAEQHDPVLAAAQAEQVAAQEKHIQGQALLKPALSLNGAVDKVLFGNQTYYTPDESSQDLHYHQWNAALNASYPLYRPSNKLQAEQGDALAIQGNLQAELSRQDLIVRVAQAYTNRCIAEETEKVLEIQRTAIEQQLKLAQKNFQVGNTTIVDTHEAQSRYDQIEAQLTAAHLNIENKKIVLQNLVGHPIPFLEPLHAKNPKLPLQFSTLDQWVDTAYHQHPLIKLAEKNVEIARLEYKKSQAALNPTIDLDSQIGWNQAQGTESLFTHYKQRTASVGIQVSYPLYSGGALTSRNRETASLYDKALNDLAEKRLMLKQSVQEAWNTVQSLESQVHALEQSVASSESALKSSQRGQEVGVRTNLDVLNAQQLRAQSQLELVKARYDYVIAVFRLYAATGILDNKALFTLNSVFVASM